MRHSIHICGSVLPCYLPPCRLSLFCWRKRRDALKGYLTFYKPGLLFVWWDMFFEGLIVAPGMQESLVILNQNSPLGNGKLIRFSLLCPTILYLKKCWTIFWLDHGTIVMCQIINMREPVSHPGHGKYILLGLEGCFLFSNNLLFFWFVFILFFFSFFSERKELISRNSNWHNFNFA